MSPPRLVACRAELEAQPERHPLELEDAVASIEDQALLLEKYQFFVMDTYVFQVPKDEQGRLDLHGTLTLHRGTAERRPPEVQGSLPDAPTLFSDFPWDSEFLGNWLEKEEPETWVWATYLVAQNPVNPLNPGARPTLDLGTVYRLDGVKGVIEQCRVQRYAPPDTPDHQLQLRIRSDGALVLDTRQSAPSPTAIVEAHLAGFVMPSALEVAHGGVPVSETYSDPGFASEKAEEDEDAMEPILPGVNAEYDMDSMRDFMTEFDDDMDDEVDDFDSPAIDM